MYALYVQYNAFLSSTFLRYLKNHFKYFLAVINGVGFFLSPFPLGSSATDERIFVSLSPPKSQLRFFSHGALICHMFPPLLLITVSLSCRVCPLKPFISLLFLNCNLFWPLFSPLTVLSEHLTYRYCWDGLLGDFPVASGVSLCFPNWMQVVRNLYLIRPSYYSNVWSGESMKEALHPAVVPLRFVVGIVAHVHVQPFYASFLW